MIKILSVIVTILIIWMNIEVYIGRDMLGVTKGEIILISIMDVLMTLTLLTKVLLIQLKIKYI